MIEHMIDTPSPFADLATWKAFLADIQAIEPRTFEVKAAIREAEKVIADREREFTA